MESIDLTILPEWQRDSNNAKLQAWYNKNAEDTSDTMKYKEAMSDQFVFIRDTFSYDLFREKLVSLEPVSTHTSKSVRLPVYKAVLVDGTTIIARCNFHDWKVSVWSPRELCFPASLLNRGGSEKINRVYCEGFKDEWVLDSYENNKKEFTVELSPGEKYMWTFLFLLNEQVPEPNSGESDDTGTEVAIAMGR
jgi:hypothetical protein